jgi:hypothetical protein
VALLALDRRYRFGHGRLFALYVLLYTVGRFWIEALRVDPANRILGLRLNLWTSVLVGLGAVVYLVVSARRRPGREDTVLRPSAVAAPPVSVADRLGTGAAGDDEDGPADPKPADGEDSAQAGPAGGDDGEKVPGTGSGPPERQVPRP